MPLPVRTCEYEHCKVEFEPRRADQVYCCRQHKEMASRQNRRKKGSRLTNGEPFSKTLYFRDPVSGVLAPVSRLERRHRFELKYKIVQGGQARIRWEKCKDPVYKIYKRKLVFREKDAVYIYQEELDGCRFEVRCIECERDPIRECEDTQRGLAWKMRKQERAEKVKAMKESGKTNAEIAEEFDVCEKTIRRDLKKLKKEGK